MPNSDLSNRISITIDEFSQEVDEELDEHLENQEWSDSKQLCGNAILMAECVWDRAHQCRNIGDNQILNQIYRSLKLERDKAKKFMDDMFELLRGCISDEEIARRKQGLKHDAYPDESMYGPLSLMWDRLGIIDASYLAEQLQSRKQRCWTLHLMIGETLKLGELPRPTQQFLALIGRSFVAGHDAECVILCRGAIDTAFRELVPDAVCEKKRKRAGPHDEYGLSDQIEAAHQDGLSKSAYDAAKKVKCRGDKAVHYDPHATEDTEGTIKLALLVIDELARKYPI